MNPSNPEGTHVAVRDGQILGVGSFEEVAAWGEHELDETFAEHVITPGFVEAHAHVMEGATGRMPYLGYFDRSLPEGGTVKGVKSYGELITRLKEIDASLKDPEAPILSRGFDPIYFDGEERLTRHHLDQVELFPGPQTNLSGKAHLREGRLHALDLHHLRKELIIQHIMGWAGFCWAIGVAGRAPNMWAA